MGSNMKKVKIYEVLHLKDFHFYVSHALLCSIFGYESNECVRACERICDQTEFFFDFQLCIIYIGVYMWNLMCEYKFSVLFSHFLSFLFTLFFDTHSSHSVMLFCWFAKFTFTHTHRHVIGWMALPFAHVHYMMIKQQTGIEIR